MVVGAATPLVFCCQSQPVERAVHTIKINPRMSTLVQTSILYARMRVLQFFLVILAATSLLPSAARSQGVSSEGKEFWLGFMPNYIDPADKLALFIASGTKNRVKIEV